MIEEFLATAGVSVGGSDSDGEYKEMLRERLSSVGECSPHLVSFSTVDNCSAQLVCVLHSWDMFPSVGKFSPQFVSVLLNW